MKATLKKYSNSSELAAKQQALAERRDISFSQFIHINIFCFFFYFHSLHLWHENSVKCFQCARWAKSSFFIFLCRSTYDLHLHLAALICECVYSAYSPHENVYESVSVHGVKYKFKYE